MWHHASLLWFSWHIHNGFGSSNEDRLFIQWPFVRLLVAGPPQVAVFFVISGYAISYKPLKLARQGHWAEFSGALSSAVFRRHSRLFIPAVTISFCTAVAAYLGSFGGEGWEDVAVPARVPPRPGNFTMQLQNWYGHTIHLVDPVSQDMFRGRPNGYDPNLWTLPVEFDCSMIIFLCLAAFARLGPRARMGFTLGLMVYTNYYTYWPVFLFASGMFLCDLRFHLDGVSPANSEYEHSYSPASAESISVALVFRKALWTASFIFALYVLCMPEIGRGGRDTPGYKTLASLIPEAYAGRSPDDFWVPLAAVLLLFTIDRASHLQDIFTGPFTQYLGRISYSLYLIHGPLLWSVGRAAVIASVSFTGRGTNEMYCLGIAMSACIFWAVAIWLADLAMRGVDVKAVELGRWAYGALVKRGS